MFCASVSRLDSLGLILQKPDITKLQLSAAVTCSSNGTSWGWISPACRELRNSPAPPHKTPQCHQLGWRFSDNTRPGLGTKLKASVLELGKRRRWFSHRRHRQTPSLSLLLLYVKWIIRNSLSETTGASSRRRRDFTPQRCTHRSASRLPH